ncbi:MAG: tRNA (adenosine(37)-N6)-threonylcarbamoyltransferase complex dimerization subunit type 1 TsaB [Bacteroidota bacterium]
MSQPILCVDSSTDICSVAVMTEEDVLSSMDVSDRRHSSMLSVLIKDCLEHSGIKPTELRAVAIGDGPGSYTGLRVGASTVKGLCYGADIPLVRVSSLETLAQQYLHADQYVMATIDARRMEAYTAIYDQAGNLQAPVASTIWSEEVIAELSQRYEQMSICGNGIAKASDGFQHLHNIEIRPSEISAADMRIPAWREIHANRYIDIAYYSPYYHKAPKITTPTKSPLLS